MTRYYLPVAIGALLVAFWLSPNAQEIAAGVAIFLFGMLMLEDGFKLLGGGMLERLLERATRSVPRSMLFGIVSTTVLQSSSLVSVITISFLSAGLISLTGGVGIIFGGAVKGSWVEAGVAAPYPTLMTKRDPFKYFKTSSEIIRLAIMMYVRFPLSLRNVEDLLHERGIDVSHEAVRHWWHRFGPMFAAEIKKRRIAEMKSCRWRWHLDEVFVKINGERHYLWRAVDHEGEVLESFVTKSRDKKAALKFLKKAMRKHGQPEVIVTDGLLSYGAALKEIGAAHRQETGRWLNNRAENSHLPFRRRERAMLRFRRMRSLQKFASVHASVYNLFNSERSLTSRANFKMNRAAALAEWRGLGAA
jgi:putative transposase